MNKFIQKYFDKLDEASRIASVAKTYIVSNWESIKDWSQLSISVENGSIYSPNEKESEIYSPDGMKIESFQTKKERVIVEPNPVKTLEVIYDELDGDMSLTINGEEWWFIENETVCFLANFIEKTIEPEEAFNNMFEHEGPQMYYPEPIESFLTCMGCKHHKNTMMKSGRDPVYADNCCHPDEDSLGGGFMQGNLQRNYNNHLETPEWCPCLLENKKEKE